MTQLPPRLHTSVNSGRSNQLIDITVMSDALEPWSHPWHALQRTLAKAFGTDAAIYPEVVQPGAVARVPEAVSWMVRARSAALPGAVLSTSR